MIVREFVFSHVGRLQSLYRLKLIETMSSSDSALAPSLPGGFDADFARLPRTNPVDARFFPPAYVTCENGVRLYVAEVRPGVVGGARRNGNDVPPQTLLVQLLENDALDKYPAEKYKNDSVSPAKFFWFDKATRLLSKAEVCWRGDTQNSLRVNSYDADGVRKYLQLHNLLGWTFLCPPRLTPYRWSKNYEVHHVDTNHGNNRLTNLEVRTKSEHRVLSGVASAAKRRKRG